MYTHSQAVIQIVNTSLQIFMILNLNPIMSIIANVPAAIASTVRISIPFNFCILSLTKNLSTDCCWPGSQTFK